jgi:predicted permease
MLTDLKSAIRQLVHSPGFALTAIVTLALGIGANAVVFSVLNAIVLHPLNVPHSESIYMVQRFKWPSQSYLDYKDLRDRNRTFESLIAYDIIGPVGVDTGSNPTSAWPEAVSGNYFDALGIQPYLGRFFHGPEETGNLSAPYVVLSYAFWNGYFQADRGIIGRTVELNKHPLTVVGVAPKDFRGTELFFAPALYVPMAELALVRGFDTNKERGDHSAFVVGHLRAGVTPQQATADLNAIGAALAKAYPNDDEGLNFTLARPGLVGDMLGGPARAFMAGLMLLAGLILLAACANLGSLFAARASDRAKDIALRLALGSKRGLILRRMLTEAVLVSLAGGMIGLIGGIVILRLLSAWQPIPDIPINVPVNPDLRTYAVAILLSIGSGLLFGMVPLRQVMRSDPWQLIRSGMASTSARRFSLRDVLLVLQIAICAVLVTSSLVAVRGLVRSLHSSFGFDPNNAVVVLNDLHMAGYPDDKVLPFQRRMIDSVAAIPGVTSVGLNSDLPLSLGGGDSYIYADTTTDYKPTNYAADAMNYNISPGYLAASGTRLLAGRDITFTDDKKSPIVAIVNRTFAVKVFGSIDKAVGGHFKFWGGNRAQVVGVVEDGKYRSLTEDQQPAMFFPLEQHQSASTFLVVRFSNPAVVEPVLRTVHALDTSLPLAPRLWTEQMSTALFPARVASVALGVLGLLGAMLAVTGIFGMASYTVSRRLRELGIRVALGAGRREVLSASLGRAFWLLTAGSVAGVVLGLLATKVLSFIVYQATPKDPFVLAGVTATMLVLGLVAATIPARRALSVDPLVLLREE